MFEIDDFIDTNLAIESVRLIGSWESVLVSYTHEKVAWWTCSSVVELLVTIFVRSRLFQGGAASTCPSFPSPPGVRPYSYMKQRHPLELNSKRLAAVQWCKNKDVKRKWCRPWLTAHDGGRNTPHKNNTHALREWALELAGSIPTLGSWGLLRSEASGATGFTGFAFILSLFFHFQNMKFPKSPFSKNHKMAEVWGKTSFA